MDQAESTNSTGLINSTHSSVATKEQNVSIKDGSNNNDKTKQSVYDAVIGANDQELARRQYIDDEEFDADDENCLPRHGKVSTNSTNSKHVIATDANDQFNGNRHTRPQNEDSDMNDYQGGLNGRENNRSSKTMEERNQNGNDGKTHHQSDEPEQIRKLFIGGLDYKTSEDTLRQHFEKFGDVIDCVVMREPQSKRSRGFGFVIYANSSMVDKAQEARPHEVDGREVQSKRAISREDSGKPEAQATVKKVYLGGLSDEIEESELRDYFKEFGNVVNINIVAHKDTGKRRGFAFVEYDDYDPVDKIVLKKYHTIRDKRIEAKKAIPKVEMDARKRGDPRATMVSAMMALSGPPPDGPNGRLRGPGRNSGACLWDAPYGVAGYPTDYSGQAGLEGYPSHYHSPSAQYGASGWMMHGGQGGSVTYGFRGSHGGSGLYGRNSYFSQASGGWTSATDHGGFAGSQGGAGPMRLSYQHRSWAPYGSGYGANRGRG